MVRVRKHVHRLHARNPIFWVQKVQIPCLGCWIATHIDDSQGIGKQDGLDHVVVHAGPWRIGDDDFGTTMFGDKFLVENIFHVACKKERIADVVDLRIDFGILDRFLHIFYPDDPFCIVGNEIGDGAGAGVEVVNQFGAGEAGKFARHLVKVISLLAVGLIKRLRTDFEPQSLHFLIDTVLSFPDDDIQIADGVVPLLIDHILQRGDLGE